MLYVVNLIGCMVDLKDKVRCVVELGVDVFLFNVFVYGLDVM